jgi:electron transport complex protein RnfB
MSGSDAAQAIDALLPQTQCTRCGYPACLPYAAAIVSGEADINQCPPGGAATIVLLAQQTGRAAKALNPVNGVETAAMVAIIDETRCIGCAKCLPPCPVDAIIGAARQMHTVVAELCTGCELCVAPCPVDCIAIETRSSLPNMTATLPPPEQSRARYLAHTERLQRRSADHAAVLAIKKRAARLPASKVNQPK